MTPEAKVVRFIEQRLASRNRFFINVHGSLFSRSGTPDIITIDGGNRFAGIEVKRPGGKASINQVRRGIEIIKSGGRFIVADDTFDVDEFMAKSCLDNYVTCGFGSDELDICDMLDASTGTVEVYYDC